MKEIYEMHGRVHLIGSCGPASPGGKICRAVPSLVLGQAANWPCSVQRLHCPPNPYLSTCWMVQRLTSRSLASSRWLTPFDRSTRM